MSEFNVDRRKGVTVTADGSNAGFVTLLLMGVGHFIFDVFLTVHISITLVNVQLDAQFFYFIIRLLQSSTCFEQRRAHHQDVKLY